VNDRPSNQPSDQPPGLLRTAAHDVGAGFSNWWTGLSNAVSPPPPAPGTPPAPPPTSGQQAAQTVRRIQTVAASALGAIGLLKGALDTGFAELTSGIAAMFPSLPAATLTMPYLGVPHTHTHPPSLIPPAPPVPLPSIGTIMFGTFQRVTINSIPSARAGDLGIAPTCGGLFPYFEITTGSSNVFIGGVRAARMGDFCKVCIPAPAEATGAVKAFAAFQQYAGFVVGALGIAADVTEAAVDDDAAMASAKALSAAMNAAQMASDAIRMAIAQLMGKDPGMPNQGAVLMGHPNVLIGGFPMVNIPNPVDMLLGKLSGLKGKEDEEEAEGGVGAGGGCG
jgi:uncharacterized Zn-binding protein involved in type VI secretion